MQVDVRTDKKKKILGVEQWVVVPPNISNKKNVTMQKQSHPNIQMFIVAEQKEVNQFVARGLKWLGFDVEIKVRLLSTSDLADFPFLRDDYGVSWCGADGIASFISNAD